MNVVKKKTSISIFFPYLNDWGTVGSLIALSIYTVKNLTSDWELIIVNDGSSALNRDALVKIVKVINLSDKDKKKVRLINHKQNMGYGGALRSGFTASKKDLIFYTDCDGQYDPRELKYLYKAMADGVGMVNGYKIKRMDPVHRIFIGKMYHIFVKLTFGLPIRDTDCDFRLIRKSVFEKVKLFESTGTICVELIKKIDHENYKIVEVPVHHFWRTSGKSQFFNFKRLFRTGVALYKLWWKLMVRALYYE